MQNRKRNSGGFTLIELLLVMVIIATLAAIIVPRLTGKSEQAKETKALADVGAIKGGLKNYEVDTGQYPTSEEGLVGLLVQPSGVTNWRGPYLDLPDNKIPVDPWGTPYIYRCPGSNGKDFDLLSAGPDKQEGTADDIK